MKTKAKGGVVELQQEGWVEPLDFIGALVFLEGSPVLTKLAPWQHRVFRDAGHRDPDGRMTYSTILTGCGKKGAKSLSLLNGPPNPRLGNLHSPA